MLLKSQRWTKTDRPKTTLLFLHGMGGTGGLWRPIAAALEDEYEVLAFDQRGHGESRLSDTSAGTRQKPLYTPLAYGQDVVETLKHLDCESVWVIGHSMGVRTACATAHLAPNLVSGLVLIDLGFSGAAGGGLGDNLGNFIRVLPTDFASRAEARAFMDAHCPDPSIAQYLLAVGQTSGDGRFVFPFDHAALIETIHSARDSSVRKWLEEFLSLGKPVLVLRGATSLVWSAEEFLREKSHFARFPTIAFEEMAGAGHGLPFEKRPQFVEILRKFVEQPKAP